nr:nsp11 [Human coronavirus HKU1]
SKDLNFLNGFGVLV